MSDKKKMGCFLIPMNDISEEARTLAVAWVENFRATGGMDIEQKHKLASDIMNYANRHLAVTLKNIHDATKGSVDEEKSRWLTEQFDKFIK